MSTWVLPLKWRDKLYLLFLRWKNVSHFLWNYQCRSVVCVLLVLIFAGLQWSIVVHRYSFFLKNYQYTHQKECVVSPTFRSTIDTRAQSSVFGLSSCVSTEERQEHCVSYSCVPKNWGLLVLLSANGLRAACH